RVDRAIEALQEHADINVTQISSIYETEPVGGPPDQPDFLNAVVEVETDLSPEELLDELQAIERELGRVRGERHGPRTLDLDLLLYGNVVQDQPGLTLPHPRMHERGFVLEPLAEIAPDAVHPRLGRTVQELWDQFEPPEEEEGVRARPRAGGRLPEGEQEEVETGQDLRGKTALVTGSTGGIGRAIALELARA